MESVYKLCCLLIRKGKEKKYILEKMDVYLAADRLSAEEYNQLLTEMNGSTAE